MWLLQHATRRTGPPSPSPATDPRSPATHNLDFQRPTVGFHFRIRFRLSKRKMFGGIFPLKPSGAAWVPALPAVQRDRFEIYRRGSSESRKSSFSTGTCTTAMARRRCPASCRSFLPPALGRLTKFMSLHEIQTLGRSNREVSLIRERSAILLGFSSSVQPRNGFLECSSLTSIRDLSNTHNFAAAGGEISCGSGIHDGRYRLGDLHASLRAEKPPMLAP